MKLTNCLPLVFAGIVAAPLSLLAQQTLQPVTLTGTVVDPSGALVPGAEVTVYSGSGSGMVVRERTDSRGVFQFQGLPGEYRVDVVASGFATLQSSPIPFTAHESSRFTMQVPGAPAARLQQTPVGQEANAAPWDFGLLFQGGLGVTEDRENFRFLLGGAHIGKVLTGQVGNGVLRGNFEYGIEVLPYWQAFTPTFQRISCTATNNVDTNPPVCSAPYTVGGTFHGASITPIILRWNFTHGQRWMPWVQGAGGLLWTDHKFPAYGNLNRDDINETGPGANTSVWNFTPQFGVGTHIFLKQRRSLDIGANAVHISSASLGDRNPGVNASVQFSIGYSWWSR